MGHARARSSSIRSVRIDSVVRHASRIRLSSVGDVPTVTAGLSLIESTVTEARSGSRALAGGGGGGVGHPNTGGRE